MTNQRLMTWFFSLILILLLCVVSGAGTEDFYAYYTRSNYDMPISSVPGERAEEEEEDDEDEEDEEDEEEDEDEEWAPRDSVVTGHVPDIVVNLGGSGQFVFSREKSYLPYWKTAEGKWFLDEVIEREIDEMCLYSYVRIIEQGDDEIVVHWRYVPDLDDAGFTGVAHEIFSIKSDGTINREIRKPTVRVDQWEVGTESLRLEEKGIEKISSKALEKVGDIRSVVEGEAVITDVVGSPAAWWKFDDALESAEDMTLESISGEYSYIGGSKVLWKKGVSGTALAFDGYYSRMILPKEKAPSVGSGVTVEAWIALGAYPWEVGDVVHQSQMSRYSSDGYSLAIDDKGHPMFVASIGGKKQVVKGSKSLKLYQWSQLAGTYDKSVGKMNVYLDGEQVGELSVEKKSIAPSNMDLWIGLNNVARTQTHHVSEKIGDVRTDDGNQPRIWGIEGLIDEVKIYDKALSGDEISRSYEILKPENLMADLQRRILPGEVGPAEEFGAYYTNLKYHELWDNLWRSSDWPDIVVKFDTKPVSVVYWRGSNYGPGWVTENNKWMSDQSCEVGTWCGCSEHMSDKENRHAHVRMIENTDARVVVHWRYASVGVMYNFPNAYAWADEYHTIYPDGFALRYVTYHDGMPGWQDVQFFIEPGQMESDVINAQALTVANLDGETYEMDWSEGIPRNRLRDAIISTVNFKSDYKVVVIYPEGDSIGAWGHRERATDETLFAGPWNHWPISQVPNDGRFAYDTGRTRHAALGGAGPRNMALYGFTNEKIDTLVPLARSWNRPPEISNAQGCSIEGYKKSERAYHLQAKSDKLSFTLKGSEEKPVFNPCFVIKGWDRSAKSDVEINSKKIFEGKGLRQGLTRDTDGELVLVVWIDYEGNSATEINISGR
ncbi:MAG: LamG domain-containing protein [Planctomycetota bacterium]|jgi:hypothetical protein